MGPLFALIIIVGLAVLIIVRLRGRSSNGGGADTSGDAGYVPLFTDSGSGAGGYDAGQDHHSHDSGTHGDSGGWDSHGDSGGDSAGGGDSGAGGDGGGGGDG